MILRRLDLAIGAALRPAAFCALALLLATSPGASLAQAPHASTSAAASKDADAKPPRPADAVIRAARELLDRRWTDPPTPVDDAGDDLASKQADLLQAEIIAALGVATLDLSAAETLATQAWALAREFGDDAAEAATHAQIARIQIDRGWPFAAGRSLAEGWRAAASISDVDAKDAAIARLALVAAAHTPAAAREAWRRALDIQAAETRVPTLEALARTLLTTSNSTAAVSAAALIEDPARRTQALLDLAGAYVGAGLYEPALAMLLASDSSLAARDRILLDLVQREISSQRDPAGFSAPHAIREPAIRDEAARAVADYQLAGGLIADALRTAGTIGEPRARAAARLQIAQEMLARQYLSNAAALIDAAARDIASSGAIALRDRLQAIQLDLALRRRDAEAAIKLWADIAPTAAAADLAVPFAELLLRSGEGDVLLDLASAAAPGPVSVAFTAAAAQAVARRYSAPSDVEDHLARVTDATARAEALLGLAGTDELWDGPSGWAADIRTKWLMEAERLLAGSERRDLREKSLSLIARHASYDAAVSAVEDIGDSRSQASMQAALAVAETRAGGAIAALQRVQRLSGSSRDKALADVATALMRGGREREALLLARQIDGWATRIRTFRGLAEAHSAMVDAAIVAASAQDIAEPQPPYLPNEEPPAPPRQEGAAEGPLFEVEGFGFYRAARLPSPARPAGTFDLKRSDPRMIRASAPLVAPGRLHVTYAAYSRHNRSFLGEALDLDLLAQMQATPHPRYLFLESGVFDLPSISRLLEAQGLTEILQRDGRIYTLRAPLLIGPDAALLVTGLDVQSLRLSRETGAALINAGRAYFIDSEIVGWSEAADAPAEEAEEDGGRFRPFYLAWSGSGTWAAETRFANLGYQGGGRSGVSFMAGPDELVQAGAHKPQAVISQSMFEGSVYGLHASDVDGLVVAGNLFQDNRDYGASLRAGSTDGLFAYNTAIGTRAMHGFVMGGGAGLRWVGNIAFQNMGSGVAVEQMQTDSFFFGNLLASNRGDGMSLRESSCALISANVIVGNRRDGVATRNSRQIALYSNWIRGNSRNAISAYARQLDVSPPEAPRLPASDLTIADNVLKGEGQLIKFDNSSTVTLGKNRLVGPKIFGGAARAVEAELLASMGRGVTVVGECSAPSAASPCPFADAGYVATPPANLNSCRREGTAANEKPPLATALLEVVQ